MTVRCHTDEDIGVAPFLFFDKKLDKSNPGEYNPINLLER